MSHLPSSHLPGLHTDQADYVDIRRHRELYVDKTQHFANLLAPKPYSDPQEPSLQTKYVFLARPRRFGKTLLVATLEAWFQGQALSQPTPHLEKSEMLFAGTAGHDSWRTQPLRPVIRLDMSEALGNTAAEINHNLIAIFRRIYAQWFQRGVSLSFDPRPTPKPEWMLPDASLSPARWLRHLITSLYWHYELKPVVLIDEYDAPITRMIGAEVEHKTQASILQALQDFYATLKAAGADLHFVFLTGISRFAKVSLFSAFNNLRDISWSPTYATLCGFTERELHVHLAPHVHQAAQNIGWGPDEMFRALRDYYNGYQFGISRAGVEPVYNPFTLASCLSSILEGSDEYGWRKGHWPNFWALSGTPAFLIRLVQQGRYELNPEPPDPADLMTATYDLDNLDYTDLMLQTGYYTFRGGDDGTPWRVDYPNREVRSTYLRSLWGLCQGRPTPLPPRTTLEWLQVPLRERQYEIFRQRLETFVAGIPGSLLGLERPFHLLLHVLGQAMMLEFGSEVEVWGGRADLVLVFAHHACVIEIKQAVPAGTALAQIRDGGCYQHLRTDRFQCIDCLGLEFLSNKEQPGLPPTVALTLEELSAPWEGESGSPNSHWDSDVLQGDRP